MDSFSKTYAAARGKFMAAASDAGARIHTYGRDDVKGLEGEHLACDVAVLGPETATRVALAISGTHGSEGFTGSAAQHRWLLSHASTPPDVRIVLVHAINPWAFSHQTRTTENNVDLNRNFIRDNVGYQRENPAYDALAPFLHIDPSDARRSLATYRAYKSYLDQHGWHLESEMLEGQCHHPDGLFYAGKEPEWSNRLFRLILGEHLAQAAKIGFVDWHTGVGSFGEVVYLITGDKGGADHAAAARWWSCDEGEASAFKSGATPQYRGLLSQAIRQELPQARVAGGVVEFGTADEYAIMRGDCLDRWIRFEGRSDPDVAHFRSAYMDIMNPPDLSWRRGVLNEGPAIMDKLIAGVAAW